MEVRTLAMIQKETDYVLEAIETLTEVVKQARHNEDTTAYANAIEALWTRYQALHTEWNEVYDASYQPKEAK